MTIRITEEAEWDLEEGWRFYDDIEGGLGDYFLDSVYSDIDSLQVTAGLHRKQFGKHRLLCSRFPFGIYYTNIDDVTVVHAVLDLRRNPSWHRRRLG